MTHVNLALQAIGAGNYDALREWTARYPLEISGYMDNDRTWTTPLHHAAYLWKREAIEILLDAGALVNVRNSYGQTPLFCLVDSVYDEGDGKETVDLFLQHGGNPYIDTDTAINAVDVSRAKNVVLDRFKRIYALKEQYFSDFPYDYVDPLWLTQGFSFAKKRRVGLDWIGFEGNNPDIVAYASVPRMLEHFESLGDIDHVYRFDEVSRTALHRAVRMGSFPKVRALIDAGANVNARDSNGQTPLALAVMYFVYCSNGSIVRALIDAGSNVESADDRGITVQYKMNMAARMYPTFANACSLK